MIAISFDNEGLVQRLRAELTLIPFLAWFAYSVIPRVQEAHFSSGRAASRSLSIGTVKARARRWGWYGKTSPKAPATAYGPAGWWSGFTMEHTTPKRGRLSLRPGVLTLQTSLKRWWVQTWWDERELDRHLDWSLDVWMQAVLDGKTPRPPLRRVAA